MKKTIVDATKRFSIFPQNSKLNIWLRIVSAWQPCTITIK